MGKVITNSMDAAGQATGHKIVYMAPSVCITPAAPGPLPMPYPIMTPTGTQSTEKHTRKVMIQGKPVMRLNSLVSSSTGNEPGTQKEIVSLKTASKAFVLTASPTVKVEGGSVAFTGSQGMGNRM